MAPRPRQARAIETRARLLESTCELLAEAGFSGCTTSAISKRAGVSQGALFKHFATKNELLVSVTSHLLTWMIDAFHEVKPAPPPEPIEERVREGVRALWRVFRQPRIQGLFEIYLAARTDPELAEWLQPMLHDHFAVMHREAARLMPEIADDIGFAHAVDSVVYAMQGAALGLFVPTPERDSELIEFFQRLALQELTAMKQDDSGACSPRS